MYPYGLNGLATLEVYPSFDANLLSAYLLEGQHESCESVLHPSHLCPGASGCQHGKIFSPPFCTGATTISFLDTSCGDGAREGAEECDDGNTISGDGCAEDCSEVEGGYVCHYEEGQRDSCFQTCGNGVIDFAETCDDENNLDLDGCSADC